MADQKTMNGRGTANRLNGHKDAAVELGGNIADFTHDVAELAELQAELFTVDLKEATDISLIPLCLGVSGFLLLLASFPVLLIGVAYLMVASWSIAPATAFFATGAGAIVISAGIVWIVWLRLSEGFGKFDRSIGELKRNFRWIKRQLGLYGSRK